MRQSIFTLVELLIVIGIIAILSSLLLPALQSAKNSAKSISCVNNQKQINTAFIEYANDYSGWMPPYSLGITYGKWFDKYLVGQYLYDTGKGAVGSVDEIKPMVLHCPSYSHPNWYWAQYFPYAYNYYYVGGYQFSGTGVTYVKIEQISSPSKTILFADSTSYVAYSNFPDNPATYPLLDMRHSGKANAMFCDGHSSPGTILSFRNKEYWQAIR